MERTHREKKKTNRLKNQIGQLVDRKNSHRGGTVVKVTNLKVAGSIPVGVIEFRSHYGFEVDSLSNRNEYQDHFLGLKAAGT